MANKWILVGALLSTFVGYVHAAPGLAPRAPSPLVKRFAKRIDCDDEQNKKIGRALADMANLGLHAYDTASKDTLGFTHYFKEDELSVFKSAMSTIASNNDPTNPSYTFNVNCKPTEDVLKECGDKSYAVTEAGVSKDTEDIKTIWICPLFWTGPDTKQNLPSGDERDEWCKQDNFKKFVTAGHVLLHEITHLDAVAKLFGLEPDKNGEHGTLDYSVGSSPITDARRLKIRIDNGQGDLQAPTYTAESYAGAATELWVQKFCKKDFVPPKKGY